MKRKSKEVADKILEVTNKLDFCRNQEGMTAVTSYIASVITGENKTQQEIAEEVNVSEAVFRGLYEDIVKRVNFIIGL